MRAGVSLGLMVLLLAGCAAQGPTEEPFSRTAQWFSYLNGDDLRRDCRPGAPDRARIVYNAVWGEQVRAYDLRPDTDGRYRLESRVFGGIQLDRFQFNDPLAVGRGVTTGNPVSNAQARALVDGLARAGLGRPTPQGKTLWSDTYFWVATVCEAGRIRFQAWPEEQEAPVAATLLPLLAGIDTSGVPVSRPPAVTVVRRGTGYGGPSDENSVPFDIRVGREGLVTGGKL